MAWDPKDGYVLMFGGTDFQSPNGPFGDTWAFVGNQWRQLHPATAPPGRSFGVMGYDPTGQRMLLYGGGAPNSDPPQNDTWAWDGSSWMQLHPAHTPTVGFPGTNMVYQPDLPALLLFGGTTRIWAWDGNDWVLRIQDHTVPDRSYFGLAYNPDIRGVILVAGGAFPPLVNDVWLWKDGAWTQLQATTGPSAGPCVAAYDTAHRRLIVFAINDGSTWAWDGTKWTREIPQHSPPPLLYFTSMVGVPTTGQVVLFGGKVDSPAAHDVDQTWIWNGQDWSQAT
jgi:hypothetical protein